MSENVVPELHQESPLWESMKERVGTCGVAAAGLTAVATVWAGGLAAPTSAWLGWSPAVPGGREGEGVWASSNSCFFTEAAKRAEWSHSCPGKAFAGYGFASSLLRVICGRRRKGEAESEQLGTAAGPGSHCGGTGQGLLSLVPTSPCHPKSIPSSSDPLASPRLCSWGLGGRSRGELDPPRWFWGAEWNRAEVLSAGFHYSSDLFKITGFIWLLNQKGWDTISLFCANSKSAALLPDFMWSFLPVLAQCFPRLADTLTEIIREDVTAVTHGAWQGLFVLYVSHRFNLLLCVPSVCHFLPLFCIPVSPLFSSSSLPLPSLVSPYGSVTAIYKRSWIFPLASARDESVHTYHMQTSPIHRRAAGSLPTWACAHTQVCLIGFAPVI